MEKQSLTSPRECLWSIFIGGYGFVEVFKEGGGGNDFKGGGGSKNLYVAEGGIIII